VLVVPAAQAHQARVAQHAVQPAPGGLRIAQHAEPEERDDAGFLNCVECVVAVAQKPYGGRVQRRPVPLQQHGERFRLTLDGQGDQLGIA
jgi:hypothetical protein